MLVAAGLVAGRELVAVVERKFIEAVVHVGEQQRAVDPQDRRGIRREPQAGGELVAGVRVAVERDVAAETVAVALVDRHAGHEPLRLARRERTADGKAAFAQRIATGARFDPTGPIRRGRVGEQADDTARGVGPERAGLRSAQNFDLSDIEGPAERAESGEIEVVDEKAHRRIRRLALVLGIFADAADLKITRSRGGAREGEIRDLVGEVAEVPHGTGAQRLLIVNGDAGRNARERRLPEIAADADRLELHGFSRGRGRRCARGLGRGGVLGAGDVTGDERRGEEEEMAVRDFHGGGVPALNELPTEGAPDAPRMAHLRRLLFPSSA